MRLGWRSRISYKSTRPKKAAACLNPSISHRCFTSKLTDPILQNSIKSRIPKYDPLSEPNPNAKHVVVVGGGITGLVTAYNLARELPNARITLFGGSGRLGGWLESERVPANDAETLFEWGPRTLRTDIGFGPGRYTAQLLAQLNMAEEIVPTAKNSPAALNRYIYYPDHLVRMPGPLPGAGRWRSTFSSARTVFQEPIFKGTISSLLKGLDEPHRPSSLHDESVGSFMTRRFGRPVADNLVSALLHGIYAGDLYNLSVKSVFPLLWRLEKDCEEGVLGELARLVYNGEQLVSLNDVELMMQSDRISDIPETSLDNVESRLGGSSVFTFKRGLGQLSGAIESVLKENANVEIYDRVADIAYESPTKKFRVTPRGGDPTIETIVGDYVVAAIPPTELARATGEPPFEQKGLGRPLFVDVMVVNLFFRKPNLVPVAGFGYLIPRSVPLEQNPERALGVIFGSETSRGSPLEATDNTTFNIGQDTAQGTKLTVMLGGHWYTGTDAYDEHRDEEKAIIDARTVLARHLGITDDPLVAKARFHDSAIPQYYVGHQADLAAMHNRLLHTFDGRLKVAGSAYHGIGVHDCVKAARKASLDIREAFDQKTGLEMFAGPEDKKWAVFKRGEESDGSGSGGVGGLQMTGVT